VLGAGAWEIVSRNGLLRKSTAPAFMVRTVIGMSPWPVMITQSPLFSADSGTVTMTAVGLFSIETCDLEIRNK
jgi:hypothetical protein